MGVIGDQPVRSRPQSYIDLDADLANYKALAKKYGVTVDTVIAARTVALKHAELDFKCVDGDYKDEWVGGIGQIMTNIQGSLDRLSEVVAEAPRLPDWLLSQKGGV